MELNAEQIKEWLEICAEDTPYPDQSKALHDALSLITSQEQRIKELEQCWEHEHASAMEIFGQWSEKCERLTEENERLRNRITATVILTDKDAEKIKNECLERVKLDIKAIQADTLRKIQDKFARNIGTYTNKDSILVYAMFNLLSEITKEILEEK